MSGRVGVLGLGNMGSVIAQRLLDGDNEVWVHNRSAARAEQLLESGAQWADDGESLAEAVDLLITMVADDAALEAVTINDRGVLRHPHPDLVYADMSTVSPNASRAVAEAAAAVGVPYLRAPVTGSTVLAASGTLGVLASGPPSALEAFEPVFACIAKRVFYLGPAEEARVMKLAINTMVGSTMLGLSESLAFGLQCGLDWESMLEVFAESAVGSPLVRYKAETLIKRDFGAVFTTSMMAKDLELALQLGRSHGAVMPTTALSHELLRATCGMGWADKDFSSTVLLYEQLAETAHRTEPPERHNEGAVNA